MTKLPDITGKQTIKALKKAGWKVKSRKGSHAKLIKTGCSHFLIVTEHGNKTIPKGTLSNIIKDSDMTIEEFMKLL